MNDGAGDEQRRSPQARRPARAAAGRRTPARVRGSSRSARARRRPGSRTASRGRSAGPARRTTTVGRAGSAAGTASRSARRPCRWWYHVGVADVVPHAPARLVVADPEHDAERPGPRRSRARCARRSRRRGRAARAKRRPESRARARSARTPRRPSASADQPAAPRSAQLGQRKNVMAADATCATNHTSPSIGAPRESRPGKHEGADPGRDSRRHAERSQHSQQHRSRRRTTAPRAAFGWRCRTPRPTATSTNGRKRRFDHVVASAVRQRIDPVAGPVDPQVARARTLARAST